jgi:hypothetical protein
MRMLFRLCAVCVVVLALSPFTAPFRAYDDQPLTPLTAPTLTVTLADNDGSVVVPLATESGRLRLQPVTATFQTVDIGQAATRREPDTPTRHAARRPASVSILRI